MTYDYFAVYSLPCTADNLAKLESSMRSEFGYHGVLTGRKNLGKPEKANKPLELVVTTPQYINAPYNSKLIWDFQSDTFTIFASEHIAARFSNTRDVRSFYLVMKAVVRKSGGRVTQEQAPIAGSASPPGYALRFR